MATSPSRNGKLSRPELDLLAELEATIAGGLAEFVRVGAALAEIRDRRLYRARFAGFDEYLKVRWGLSRAHGFRLMDAAGVVADLAGATDQPPRMVSPIGDTTGTKANVLPARESQARPLVPLPPAARRAAWSEAVARSGGKAPPADLVRRAAADRGPDAKAKAKAKRKGLGPPPIQAPPPAAPAPPPAGGYPGGWKGGQVVRITHASAGPEGAFGLVEPPPSYPGRDPRLVWVRTQPAGARYPFPPEALAPVRDRAAIVPLRIAVARRLAGRPPDSPFATSDREDLADLDAAIAAAPE